MKSIIKNAFFLSAIVVVVVELYISMGGKLKVPLSNHINDNEHYWFNVIVEFVIFFICIVFLLFLAKKKDEQVKKKERNEVSQLHDDPILNEIIENAMSGKITDDILKTQNDDSETEKEVDDDNKEYQ